MKIDEVSLFREKAKTRKDGIYSLRGYLWVVIDNHFVSYMDYSGDFYQVMGHFVIKIGTVKDRYIRKSEIKKWMEEEKKSMLNI